MQAGITIPIADKIDFKLKLIKRGQLTMKTLLFYTQMHQTLGCPTVYKNMYYWI